EAFGSFAVAANGALGISSNSCDESGRSRRTATRAPAALILSAVANSRNSLPLSSRLFTKTGIANGNRGHLRRSAAPDRITHTPSPAGQQHCRYRTLWAKFFAFS